MLKKASLLAHNDTVDGSEIPNNHRLDVEKTLLNNGYPLPFPQLVNDFSHQQVLPPWKVSNPVPTSICWTSAVSVLEWDVDLGFPGCSKQGFLIWCKTFTHVLSRWIPRVVSWVDSTNERMHFCWDWAGWNAVVVGCGNIPTLRDLFFCWGPSIASRVHRKGTGKHEFYSPCFFGNSPNLTPGKKNNLFPIGSMGLGYFTYIQLIFIMVNVGKYIIHGSYGFFHTAYQEASKSPQLPKRMPPTSGSFLGRPRFLVSPKIPSKYL